MRRRTLHDGAFGTAIAAAALAFALAGCTVLGGGPSIAPPDNGVGTPAPGAMPTPTPLPSPTPTPTPITSPSASPSPTPTASPAGP